MGILKGALSYRRYILDANLPSNFKENFVENANRTIFKGFSDNTEEEVIGWVTVSDLLSENIGFNDLFGFHGYLLISLRKDTKVIPGNILIAYTNKELKKQIKSGSLQKITSLKRSEVKEAMKLRLIEKIFPKSSQYDISWNLESGVVRFFNNSDSVNDNFVKLFKNTFMNDPVPMNQRYYLFKNGIKVSESILEYVGYEFLTWLLYAVNQEPEALKEIFNSDIEIWFDDMISFKKEDKEISLKGFQINDSRETQVSLEQGSLVSKAKIFFRKNEREWAFTISGKNLDLTSAKLPDFKEKKETSKEELQSEEITLEGKFFNRVYDLEELDNFLDTLFNYFLKMRKEEKGWNELQKEIRKWIERG